MVIAPAPLLIVVAARPHGEANRLVRVFVERLLEKLRTRQAVMHPERLTAAFGHGRDARVGLELGRGRPACAVGAEGGREARGADRPGPGETCEERVVGMVGEDRRDLRVEGGNGREQGPQLGGVALDRETERVDDRRVGRERLGRGHLVEPGVDHRGAAAVVLLIEPAHRGGAGPLDGGQRRPRGEKVAGLPRVERPDPVEGLGEILLEEARDPVRQAAPQIHELPAVLAEQLELARRHRIRVPGPELVAMFAQQVQEEGGIGGVVLGPAAVEGFAIARQSCAPGFSWTLDCERVLAGDVSKWGNQIRDRRRRRATGDAAGRGRVSARRKRETVLRLLRGEDLESVSRELGITAARASQWRDQFLAAGQASLKSRAPDARDADNRRLQAKIGELLMENELLYAKVDQLEAGGPLARRRSRR